MSRHAGLTPAELTLAESPPPVTLGRLATVTDDGDPHVVPVGWSWDGDRDVFVLGGRDVRATARAGHVRARRRAALVIDGVDTDGGWRPWALLVRGRAEMDDALDAILLHPDEVTSWGLPRGVS